MKVYLVYRNNDSMFYPDTFEEVFSTKENAEVYIQKQMFKNDYYIREEELDSALE